MTEKTKTKSAKPRDIPAPPIPETVSIPTDAAVCLHNAMTVAISRGAFKGEELQKVGQGFDALNDVFKALAPPAPAPEPENEKEG